VDENGRERNFTTCVVVNITLDLRGVDEMQRHLETIAKKAVPYAARETLNTLAFRGRAIWQEEMASSLTLRNKFTQRGARVDMARTLRVDSMEATLGHTEDYMYRLEHGKSERAAQKWRPIPTEVAAGQAYGSLGGGRKKAVKRANIIKTLGSLKTKGFRGRSRKAQNARAITQAAKSGKRLALLDLGNRKGIYRVMGKKKLKVRKLYDLSRKVTPMPRIPTLQRTLDKTLTLAPRIAYEAMQKQLHRHHVGTR
jgi:hypothetical protein